MSAYIVNKNHINVIVSWFTENGLDDNLYIEIKQNYSYMTKELAPIVAQTLYSQNVRSVNDRYNDNTSDEQYSFEYLPNIKNAYSLAEIAGAIDGLEYQSCESDDYKTTDAYKIITAMRKELLKKVQAEQLGDNTTWSIGELKDQPAKFELAPAYYTD